MLFNNAIILFISVIVIITYLLHAPMGNDNHPLNNKMIVAVIALIDFTLSIVFYINRMIIATHETNFIILNGSKEIFTKN